MGHTLENPEENSLFFHPYFVEQERADLQQELVMIFNKIIDISSEDELQSAAKDMARVALISPHLALTKAVYEGVKSAGHSKSICCVSVYVQSSLHYWPTRHNGNFFGRQSTFELLFKALYNSGRREEVQLYMRDNVFSLVLLAVNPSSPSVNQHQFSPNHIHQL